LPERLCRSTAASSSDFANSARGGSVSAEVHSEAERNLLGGIEGLLSSMCTLPRQVERCTVLGPKPQGETVLPLCTS
jgi:hypothetical protein